MSSVESDQVGLDADTDTEVDFLVAGRHSARDLDEASRRGTWRLQVLAMGVLAACSLTLGCLLHAAQRGRGGAAFDADPLRALGRPDAPGFVSTQAVATEDEWGYWGDDAISPEDGNETNNTSRPKTVHNDSIVVISWQNNSSKCLAIDEDDGSGVLDGLSLVISDCNETDIGFKFLVPSSGSDGVIKSVKYLDLCLDTPDANMLQFWTCDTAPVDNVRFTMPSGDSGNIVSSANWALCLDVPDILPENGCHVHLANCANVSSANAAGVLFDIRFVDVRSSGVDREEQDDGDDGVDELTLRSNKSEVKVLNDKSECCRRRGVLEALMTTVALYQLVAASLSVG